MKKLLVILFLVSSYVSFSQGQPTALPTLFNGKFYQYTQYLAVDSGLFSPRRDTNFVPKQGGCILFRQADSTIYISTGNLVGRKWKAVGSGQGGGSGVYNAGYGMLLVAGNFSVDTSLISTVAYSQGLYNILNVAKLNISDTASMLIPYLRKADTTAMLSKYLRKADTVTLSNRINLKLNISDTSTMLSPYLRKADTATLSNRINLKLNISDTSSMLGVYLRKQDTITLSNRIDLKRNISDTALNAQSTTTRGRSQYLIDSLNSYVGDTYLPLAGGTISGNLRVNGLFTNVSGVISQGEIQAQSNIRHTTLKILNKDTSAYVTWLDRKPYYSDGVNLSLIGTLDADTITSAKVAKYSSNVAGNYTDRSFTDKNYVDSSLRYRKIKIVGDSDVVVSAINDEIIFFKNITVTSRDITLPNPTSYTGKVFRFSVLDTMGKRSFVVTGGSDVLFLDNTVCGFITVASTFELTSDGTNWLVTIAYYK